MKSEEQNSNNREVSYKCNFVLLSRKEKIEEPIGVSEPESVADCFPAPPRKVQKLIEMS